MYGRTTVTLLEPQQAADGYGQVGADWSLTPTSHPGVPASVDPVSSSEAVLTAGTVISRWTCYLTGDTAIGSTWRVRWRGLDYDIDGEVMVNEGSYDTYLSLTLKRVAG